MIYGFVGDTRATLCALLPLLQQNDHEEHLRTSREHYRNTRKGLDDLAVKSGKNPIHPQYVTRELDRLAAPDTIFTCDVGTPTIWATRYLTMNGRRRIVGSFNHGSLANALPQAIGAQAGHPGRQVVSMCGDGGLAMLMGDLAKFGLRKSVAKSRMPAAIISNSTNANEPFLKTSTFTGNWCCRRVSKVAEAAGLLGLSAETTDDVSPVLEQALNFNGPALVEIPVPRHELSMPPTITYEQAKGFGLFTLRAVLNERTDELIDLAKVNLLR